MIEVKQNLSVPDLASLLLVEAIILDEESRFVVHEIIRQSLILPVEFNDVTRTGIFLLTSWVFTPVSLSWILLYCTNDRHFL